MRAMIPAAIVLLALAAAARAQSVELATVLRGADGDGAEAALQVFFDDAPLEEGSADLALRLGRQLELLLELRRTYSLGPAGNVIAALAGAGSSSGDYGAFATARGVLGPAALRARVGLYSGAGVEVAAWQPLPAPAAFPGGVPVWSVELGGSYRAERSLVVSADAALFSPGGRYAARFAGELLFLRLRDDDDAALLLHAYAHPDGPTSVAVGGAYTFNRRRAPAWSAALWVGDGPRGTAPGLRVSGAERFGQARLELLLAAEPFRGDVLPYRLDFDYLEPQGPGQLHLDLSIGTSDWRKAEWELSAGYQLPLPR